MQRKIQSLFNPFITQKRLITALLFACSMHLNVVSGQIPDHFTVNPEGEGHEMEVGFTKGKAHNHPLIAVWVEDTLGHFIQTLYVSQSIGTGIFNYGDKSSGQWTKGELSRPAALPYWAHKRGILSDNGSYMPTSKNPVADAYTGPTPKSDFTLNLKTDSLLNSPFYVLLEINQPWDWNEYWTNTKFPDDYEYRTSSQPAVVYRCMIDPAIAGSETIMQAIGHSHYSGKDGNLYGDISTLTTALNIAGKITVKLIK